MVYERKNTVSLLVSKSPLVPIVQFKEDSKKEQVTENSFEVEQVLGNFKPRILIKVVRLKLYENRPFP